MARAGRIFVASALNHIVIRAVAGIKVFRKNDDYKLYKGLIRRYKMRFHCKIYGYCLMPNHIHIVLGAISMQAMSAFAHGLNLSYAVEFNTKYNRTGHLWQNRYKNYIVANDKYLFNLISYIEFNPVRAGIVEAPEDYRWSSYRGRVLGQEDLILDPLNLSGDRSEANLETGIKLRLETSPSFT